MPHILTCMPGCCVLVNIGCNRLSGSQHGQITVATACMRYAAPMTSTVGSASISSSMASLKVSHMAFSFFAAAEATDLRPASGVEYSVSLLGTFGFDLAAICGQPRT